MSNPVLVASQGKGAAGLYARAHSILQRYGLTSARMDGSLELLMNILNHYEAKATLPITASALHRDKAIGRTIQSHGIELAVHGLYHVDYSQLDFEIQLEHLRRARLLFEKAGCKAVGFRAPYLRWNQGTIAALQTCGFDYESSQALDWGETNGLETNSYRRVLAFYHSQSASMYPSLPRLENGLVRIPYCLPDDEALVERLQLPCGAMAEVWVEMFEKIHRAGELFTLGLHPERSQLCQDALQAVLVRARAQSANVWITNLGEISAWYRGLGQACYQVNQSDSGHIRISIQAPDRAAVLVRALKVSGSRIRFGNGYERVSGTEFSVQSGRHPFIGLSPDTPASLRTFLQHQGYLVEMSTNAKNFSFYLDRRYFTHEDERSLLTEIEAGKWPLVRLGRWPDGAQSALAVTGDIDTITLLDFGLRMIGR